MQATERASQHLIAYGDEDIAFSLRRHIRRTVGPGRTRRDMTLAQRFVDVMNNNVKTIAQQTRRQMSAQIAKANITVFHTFTGWLVISRCSLSPV